jgi:hypothetical protein
VSRRRSDFVLLCLLGNNSDWISFVLCLVSNCGEACSANLVESGNFTSNL